MYGPSYLGARDFGERDLIRIKSPGVESRKGQPYSSSNGLSCDGPRGLALNLVRAIGSKVTQDWRSSSMSLVRCSFIRLLARSTLPEDWGW